MSYLKEQAEWADGIYQIETSDPVLDGPDGITNRPTRELANRTVWLKQQLTAEEAALAAHTRSRNHPDASLSEKGFVKLSNANQSSSETEAATPKAVKIVNDRLNAVVDHAPSTLDTLNKLAKALDNNPKFAETLNRLLDQKLAKVSNLADVPDKEKARGHLHVFSRDEVYSIVKSNDLFMQKNKNGADVPDKNQFLKNIGLLETINLAKNATPNHRKINGKTLTHDVQLTATDVHAVTPEVLRVEIPVGVPLPWPTEKPPAGWRICNGDSFDKKQYPLLALAYPSGKLPDLRGEFIRGWDAGRKVDNGRKILSAQGDTLQNFTGQITGIQFSGNAITNGIFKMGKRTGESSLSSGTSGVFGVDCSANFQPDLRTASETRPRNVAFNYIVRAA